MKKNIKIFLVLFLTIMVTGCYSMDAKMNIKDDKSMEFTILHVIDEIAYNNYAKEKEDVKTINQLLEIEKINKNMIPRGYKIEDYNQGTKKGVLISKKFDSIDDISREGDEIRVTLSDIAEESFDEKDRKSFG